MQFKAWEKTCSLRPEGGGSGEGMAGAAPHPLEKEVAMAEEEDTRHGDWRSSAPSVPIALSVSPRCGAGADLEPGSASRLGKLTDVGAI